jgi:DNA-binding PadR family transcriptional regulator
MESFGQIYPELRRLVDERLAERIDEGKGARDQKRYRLTSPGRDSLEAWLARPPQPDLRRSELLLKSFFGRFARRDQVRAHLAAARREAMGRLAYLSHAGRQVVAEDRESPALPFYLMTLDAGRRAARFRADWAEEALRYLDLHESGGAEAVIAAFREGEEE